MEVYGVITAKINFEQKKMGEREGERQRERVNVPGRECGESELRT